MGEAGREGDVGIRGRGWGAGRWVLLLIGGCVLNLMVAWALAYLGVPKLTYYMAINRQVTTIWESPGVAEWLVGGTQVPSELSYLDELAARERRRRNLHVSAGWPSASFKGIAEPPPRPAGVLAFGWIAPSGTGQATVPLRRSVGTYTFLRPLPWRPVWPGFIVNTLFWSLVLAALVRAAGHVRSWNRRRRGCCAACAYPVGIAPRCSECGVMINERGRLRRWLESIPLRRVAVLVLSAAALNLLSAWVVVYFGIPTLQRNVRVNDVQVAQWNAPGMTERITSASRRVNLRTFLERFNQLERACYDDTLVLGPADIEIDLAELAKSTRADDDPRLHSWSNYRIQAGWPWVAFDGEVIRDQETKQGRGAGAIVLHRTIDGNPLMRPLPWRPMWAGFISNTLLWMVVLLLLVRSTSWIAAGCCRRRGIGGRPSLAEHQQ